MIDIEDPVFASRSEDMLKIIADYCTNTNQEMPETTGEIAYNIFISLALLVKKYLLELETIIGTRIEVLYIVGGGVYNSLLCQLISNVTGLTLIAGPAEAASFGNLIIQLMASGDIKSLTEGRELISKSFKLNEYTPMGKTFWEEGYDRFIKVINLKHLKLVRKLSI